MVSKAFGVPSFLRHTSTPNEVGAVENFRLRLRYAVWRLVQGRAQGRQRDARAHVVTGTGLDSSESRCSGKPPPAI